MIKRTTFDIQFITKRFPEDSKDFLEKIKEFQPEEEDLVGAIDGLLRLQFMYKLKSKDFANGIIDGKHTRKALSTHDLFYIGAEAMKMNDQQYFALDYLTLAWERIRSVCDINDEVHESDLVLHLTKAFNNTGDFQSAIKLTEFLIQKFPNISKLVDIRDSFNEAQLKVGNVAPTIAHPFNELFHVDGTYHEMKEKILYGQVCRGDVTKSAREQAQLKCRYISKTPFARLARFKVEEANLEPYIVLFVDVLFDSEIEFLMNVTKPVVSRAKTYSENQESNIGNNRVAQVAAHHDHEYEVLQRISRRLEVSF